MNEIKVGIIGLGKQGKVHLQGMWPGPRYRVTHCFDQDPRCSAPSTVTKVDTREKLIAAVDLVMIATPPVTHFEIARETLSAGKHVVVEKPTTISLEETELLVQCANSKNVVLMTHFSRRWDQDFLHVKRTVEAGVLGPIHTLESRVTDKYDCSGGYPGRAAWKLANPGGGILLDWSPHLFDQIFELFPDEEPSGLFCHAERPNEVVAPGIEEQFELVLFYPDKTVTLSASWNAGLPFPRWHVLGRTGALRIEEADALKARIRYRHGGELIDKTDDVTSDEGRFPDYAFRVLENSTLSAREKLRARRVAYSLDLARRSAVEHKCIPWEYD